MRPWIVKLGGSLARGPHLREWLELLAAQRERPVLVVPGGGAFADTVREAQRRHGFDDLTGHRMALLGMAQQGLMLAALAGGLPLLRDLPQAPLARGSHLWLPLALVEGEPGPGDDWDHTSDSIALWLAAGIGAERLLLIKSVTPEEPLCDAAVLTARGVIDAAFPGLLAGFAGDCHWLGPRQAPLLARALAGETAPLARLLPPRG